MKYILIVYLFGMTKTISMQEFDSEKQCKAAIEWIELAQPLAEGWRSIVCIQK